VRKAHISTYLYWLLGNKDIIELMHGKYSSNW